MTDAGLTRATALRRIRRRVFDEALKPVGFEQRTSTIWVRPEAELEHEIVYATRWGGSYDLEWGVNSPAGGPMLWGTPRTPTAPGFGVIRGTVAAVVDPPAIRSLDLDEKVRITEIERVIPLLVRDVRAVQTALRPFTTRRDVRAWAGHVVDRQPPPGFVRSLVFPSSEQAARTVIAIMAVLDCDADAADVVARFDETSAARSGILKHRHDQLHAALARCPNYPALP